MKIKNWIFMLLVCMISFTGFSTTTDLIQNSDDIVSADQDIGETADVNFVVTLQSDFAFSEETPKLFVANYSDELIAKTNLFISIRTTENVLTRNALKPPLIQKVATDLINYKPPLNSVNKDRLNYRRARDGINYIFSC